MRTRTTVKRRSTRGGRRRWVDRLLCYQQPLKYVLKGASVFLTSAAVKYVLQTYVVYWLKQFVRHTFECSQASGVWREVKQPGGESGSSEFWEPAAVFQFFTGSYVAYNRHGVPSITDSRSWKNVSIGFSVSSNSIDPKSI